MEMYRRIEVKFRVKKMLELTFQYFRHTKNISKD
jgi:hypothetical protein